ncbi:hypothetical protein R1sor_002360 [Riccia sorocarpa]|uniref:Uncharacterized protein n=1 Tax=Riccia sorocarpa TaxID=122646 RepID=A0ABD3GZF9_9MARC
MSFDLLDVLFIGGYRANGYGGDEERNWVEGKEAVTVNLYAVGKEKSSVVRKFRAHHERSAVERNPEELEMVFRPGALPPLLHRRPSYNGSGSDRSPPSSLRLQLQFVALPFPVHKALSHVHIPHASAASPHDVSRGGNHLTPESREMRHPSVQQLPFQMHPALTHRSRRGRSIDSTPCRVILMLFK